MRVLVIDIGGTFIKYACMTEKMEFLTRGKVPTPQEGREELVETIGRLYDRMPEVSGIAVSMTGIIDSDRGYCAMGGALRYNDGFYLRDRLSERCPVRIHMENDAKCAAMAEGAVGSLADVADGFAVIFGTMIGGGFIKDHKLYRGRHFSAGEVSYIITDRKESAEPDYVWGNRCGVPALCKSFAEKKGLRPQVVDGVRVFEAVNRNDADALESLSDYTREIAVQLFNIQLLLDPERFAVGGGISAQPVFLEYIKKHLEEIYEKCPYAVPKAEIVCCKFRNDANLVGALQCFLAEA